MIFSPLGALLRQKSTRSPNKRQRIEFSWIMMVSFDGVTSILQVTSTLLLFYHSRGIGQGFSGDTMSVADTIYKELEIKNLSIL